eukprot:gene32303-54765_t
MDFDFSDDQEQLRDAVRKWVDKGYTFERRRATVAAGGFDRAAWGELAELGLTALTVPEAHDGMGQGAIDAMVVAEELGRGMVLEPISQAFIASSVLSHYAPADVQGAWLPRVASGEALVVLAYQERKARYRLDVCEAKAASAPVPYEFLATHLIAKNNPGVCKCCAQQVRRATSARPTATAPPAGAAPSCAHLSQRSAPPPLRTRPPASRHTG